MIDQDRDILAAEYVLGTLGPDERAEAQALIAIDSRFGDVVRSWERRLGELSAMVDPVEPPADMWDRIKAGIAASQASAPEPVGEAASAPPVAAPAVAAPAVAAPAALSRAEEPVTPAPVEPTPVPPPTPAAEPAMVPPPALARSEAAAPEGATPAVTEQVAEAVEVASPVAAASSVAAPSVQAPAPPAPTAAVIPFARPLRRWRVATLGLGALAACLAALVALQLTNPDVLPPQLQPRAKVQEVVRTVEVPSPKPAEFVAVLQKDASSPAFLLTFDLDKRTLTVRTVGAERQAGKSYELWLVSDKYAGPRSLGLIGTQPYTVRQAEPEYDSVVINRATYAVSLEPEGGSPTGAPTGPVLYSGRLLQATAPDFPARTP